MKSELAPVPDVARGPALVFFLAASLALAFMGFAGLFSS
jgi:Na+-translocating ferredoxin:NAD+ oxidoreductase RnfA subunit